MRADPPPIGAVLNALDADEVADVADICGRAPELAIALHHRFGSHIHLIDVTENGHFDPNQPNDFTACMRQLKQGGVDPGAITIVRRRKALRRYDVVLALDGFGVRHKVQALKPIFDRVLHPLSRVVMALRKGSGAYPFLNSYGGCNTLIPATGPQNGLVVMSVEPQNTAAGQWSDIAAELAGADGFFRDLDEHSFLYVPRGDTLVVTFDNLDIAMTKREDRRPWGFDFIEKQGWSMLGVMANGWTWFRGPEVAETFNDLRASGFFDRFTRVVFYGASMGGYAAAAYAAAAPGSTVFTISPQSTLDRALVPWETRYRKAWDRDFSGPFGDAAIASQTAHDVHIMFDPHVTLDAGHAARFTGSNVTYWRCPLLGHRLGSSLAQMGILQDIAREIIGGEMTRARFYRLLRARRDFPRYQRELANLALEQGHAGLARRVCDHVLRQREDAYFRNLRARL